MFDYDSKTGDLKKLFDYEKINMEIDKISKYSENWDGYLGKAFSEKAINNCKLIVNGLNDYCQKYNNNRHIDSLNLEPRNNGDILITMVKGSRSYEIFCKDCLQVDLVRHEGGPMMLNIGGEFHINNAQLFELFQWLFDK